LRIEKLTVDVLMAVVCMGVCQDDRVIMERAERDGHIHWNRLQDVVLAHPTTTFVLIHFR
jgi:hypothetical protein